MGLVWTSLRVAHGIFMGMATFGMDYGVLSVTSYGTVFFSLLAVEPEVKFPRRRWAVTVRDEYEKVKLRRNFEQF
jgi:hypothetical protein